MNPGGRTVAEHELAVARGGDRRVVDDRAVRGLEVDDVRPVQQAPAGQYSCVADTAAREGQNALYNGLDVAELVFLLYLPVCAPR